MYIDSHTHFNNICRKEKHLTPAGLISDMQAAGIDYAVQVAVDAASLQYGYNLARQYRDRGIRFTLGLQPSSVAWDTELEQLDRFVAGVMQSDPGLLLGIGECGLDYFHMWQEKTMQLNSFQHQIYLAKKYRLPLIIHCRDAAEDTLQLLKNNAPAGGIMHCFQGDSKLARRFLDLGFHISFAGNVTYKKAYNLHEAAAYVPPDRLLVETDAPYLVPEPLRGKINKPQYIIHTYRYLADLRKQPLEELKQAVYNNFMGILKRDRVE